LELKSLRDFIGLLEQQGELLRIKTEVDTHLEITAFCQRMLKSGGPALLFERPKEFEAPVLGNLFGTPERVALAMGQHSPDELREVGRVLAFLKEPELPTSARDMFDKLPAFKKLLDVKPKVVSAAPCAMSGSGAGG